MILLKAAISTLILAFLVLNDLGYLYICLHSRLRRQLVPHTASHVLPMADRPLREERRLIQELGLYSSRQDGGSSYDRLCLVFDISDIYLS